MTERATVVVTAELAGIRLDRTLAKLAGLSRAQTRQLIEDGEVIVSGKQASRTTTLHSGDIIEYPPPPPEESFIPEPVPFSVAATLDEVLVVDKPAGLVVHPGAGNKRGTLAHGLAHRYPELAELGPDHRWGLVHRLDRDTSGLLLVARTAEMHEYLQRELEKRRVGRTYRALAAGRMAAATGTIEAPIGRDPLRPTRMAIVREGRPARTHYRRLTQWDDVTLVEIELETGRTHQIRVHFASIGHALVGDAAYADAPVAAGDPGRVWLHAIRLRFRLPDGEEHTVESPLSEDLEASLRALGDPIR